MKSLNELTLTVFSLLLILTNLFILQLSCKKVKNKSLNEENNIKSSYGIWIFLLSIPLIINSYKTISLYMEAIDIIFKNDNQRIVLLFTTSFLFIGLNSIWYFIGYYTSKLLSFSFLRKRNIQTEMSNGNISYFLIRGIVFIMATISLLPLFELIIRIFMPNLTIPAFYS